jgi:HlyD family secretion protein
MKKRTIYILLSVIIIIVAAIVAKKSGWIGKSTAIEVTVEEAIKRTIVETVSASGKIQPEVEVKISADVSGEIVELYILEGQKVKKGDHLLTINPDLIKAAADRVGAALNQSKANLANSRAREVQAKATFSNIELSYNRTKKLHDQRVVSDAEFDNARSQYEGAKADIEAARQTVLASEFTVKSAEASLKEANDNLNRTRIYAPTDGTISKLNVEKGERVVGTAQMSGTELLRIANLNEMEVSVNVNENDIVRLHLNDTSEIEVDAYGSRKFSGIVTEIANSANTSITDGNSSDQVTNFAVKIRILRTSYSDLIDENNAHLSPFRPGMTATVEIKTRTERNVMSVPIMAVTTRTGDDLQNDGKENKLTGASQKTTNGKEETEIVDELKEVVFVYSNGQVNLVEVQTGIQDNNYIQILKGIKPGQEVISAPYSAISKVLKSGMEVTKVTSSQLNKKLGVD